MPGTDRARACRKRGTFRARKCRSGEKDEGQKIEIIEGNDGLNLNKPDSHEKIENAKGKNCMKKKLETK
mgnify:CR=1 FL=1